MTTTVDTLVYVEMNRSFTKATQAPFFIANKCCDRSMEV